MSFVQNIFDFWYIVFNEFNALAFSLDFEYYAPFVLFCCALTFFGLLILLFYLLFSLFRRFF